MPLRFLFFKLSQSRIEKKNDVKLGVLVSEIQFVSLCVWRDFSKSPIVLPTTRACFFNRPSPIARKDGHINDHKIRLKLSYIYVKYIFQTFNFLCDTSQPNKQQGPITFIKFITDTLKQICSSYRKKEGLNKKKSTTSSCNGPIPSQKSRGNSVLGVIFSHTMPRMDVHYSHRLVEKTH